MLLLGVFLSFRALLVAAAASTAASAAAMVAVAAITAADAAAAAAAAAVSQFRARVEKTRAAILEGRGCKRAADVSSYRIRCLSRIKRLLTADEMQIILAAVDVLQEETKTATGSTPADIVLTITGGLPHQQTQEEETDPEYVSPCDWGSSSTWEEGGDCLQQHQQKQQQQQQQQQQQREERSSSRQRRPILRRLTAEEQITEKERERDAVAAAKREVSPPRTDEKRHSVTFRDTSPPRFCCMSITCLSFAALGL